MENMTLMLGDCLERMKEIPDGSVDAIVSDIPYGISFASWDVKHENTNKALLGQSPAQEKSSLFAKRGKPKNGWSSSDRSQSTAFQEFCEKVFEEAARICKPCSPIIILAGRQWNHRMIVAAENKGITLVDTLAWNKGKAAFRAQRVNKVPSAKGFTMEGDWRLGCAAPVWEPITWLRVPYKVGDTLTQHFLKEGIGCFNANFLKENLVSIDSYVDNKLHETQKPIQLMELLIETFTQKSHVVLDPFMGSGTTGVACKNLKRKFIGIEKDEKYFEIAEARIGGNL